MSLRILHISPYFEPAWAYGGIPRVVGALSHALSSIGLEITVATTDAHSAHARWRREAASVAEHTGSPRLYVFPNLSNRLAYRLQLFCPRGLQRFLRARGEDFDLFHIHACHNLLATMAGRAASRAGVPYIVSPHGTAPRIERRRLPKWIFDQLFARALIPDAARLLAVSELEKQQLLEMGAPAHRIDVVANPLDFSEFESLPAAGSFRQAFGLGDQLLIGFLGKLTPRKNLDLLLRAFAHQEHRDSRLVIAGNDMGVERKLRRLAVSLGIADRVTMTGLLAANQRLAMLQDIDLLVYPSVNEAFGLVPLESILCGTPAIVGADAGCAETLDHGHALRRLQDWTVEELSATIESALALDRGLLERACLDGGRTIRQHCHALTVAQRLEKIYLTTARGRIDR